MKLRYILECKKNDVIGQYFFLFCRLKIINGGVFLDKAVKVGKTEFEIKKKHMHQFVFCWSSSTVFWLNFNFKSEMQMDVFKFCSKSWEKGSFLRICPLYAGREKGFYRPCQALYSPYQLDPYICLSSV